MNLMTQSYLATPFPPYVDVIHVPPRRGSVQTTCAGCVGCRDAAHVLYHQLPQLVRVGGPFSSRRLRGEGTPQHTLVCMNRGEP